MPKYHPAKALAAAVTVCAMATHLPENVRGTDITVTQKWGRYNVNCAGTEWNNLSRERAIETIKQLLTN